MKNVSRESGFVKFVRILLLIILSPIVLIYLITRFFKRLKDKKRNAEKIKIYSVSQLDTMSGTEFESFLKVLFEKMEYYVLLTKISRDYGADLIIKKGGKESLVQAKCYTKTVGIKAVQEIIGAKNHYKISDTIVVSNNYFSKDAETLALENNVRLINRDSLIKFIEKYPVFIERKTDGLCALKPENIIQIESKYKYWI